MGANSIGPILLNSLILIILQFSSHLLFFVAAYSCADQQIRPTTRNVRAQHNYYCSISSLIMLELASKVVQDFSRSFSEEGVEF